MKTPRLLFALLLAAAPALAQESFTEKYQCHAAGFGVNSIAHATCVLSCLAEGYELIEFAEIFSCQLEGEILDPAVVEARCLAMASRLKHRNCATDFNYTPLPATENPPTSGSGGGGSAALVVGGAVVAGIVLWNAFAPELPDGVEFRPTGNTTYRDGFARSNFGLYAAYGDWSAVVSSSHAGQGWTKPYARIRWEWAWEF